jgi:uncharacterized membrane protein
VSPPCCNRTSSTASSGCRAPGRTSPTDEAAVASDRYERETLEFERVAFFSDAVYAIALTLLVTSLEVPSIADSKDAGDLWRALNDLRPQIITFFVSFAVIGSFWLAHHRFFGRLQAIDRPSIYINLAYLAFVAFLPFPSSLLGEYSDNAAGVTFYAISLALVSGLEPVLLWVSWRRDLLRVPIARDALRWELMASGLPVLMFLVSIPIAYASPLLGILTWLATFPAEMVLDRFRPETLKNASA